jgi:hypothetical protein
MMVSWSRQKSLSNFKLKKVDLRDGSFLMHQKNKREVLDMLDHFSISNTHPQPHSQASTIYLILSSIPDSLHSTTKFGCPGISHHDFVGASFEIRRWRSLKDRLGILPWDSIGSLPDANLKVFRLDSLLVALFNRFAPLRTYNRRAWG